VDFIPDPEGTFPLRDPLNQPVPLKIFINQIDKSDEFFNLKKLEKRFLL
jgi:hypothetical protein